MNKYQNKGIICAGNWILDEIIFVNKWPKITELSKINEIKYSSGGSAFNVICNFNYYNAPFKTYGVGCIGNDTRGKTILKICKKNNISTRFIKTINNCNTSFTNVVVSPKTKERTFFYFSGANNKFNSNFVAKELIDNSKISIFHLGYLCLLKGLEKKDKNKKLNIENLFKKIKKNDIDISLDTITLRNFVDYKKILVCLKYVDHLIINEKEALLLSNINIIKNNKPKISDLIKSCKILSKYGIKKNIIIHNSNQVIWYDKIQIKLKKFKKIPPNKIKNKSGAGDSFLTGILWGLNLKWSKEKTIKFAHKLAIKNLKLNTSSSFLT